MTTIEYLRQFRIGGYAIFDFSVSFLLMFLIAPVLTKAFRKIRLEISRSSWLYLTIPLSILIHLLVGNITPMTANFFALEGHYLLKIVVLIMLFLGIKGLRFIKKQK